MKRKVKVYYKTSPRLVVMVSFDGKSSIKVGDYPLDYIVNLDVSTYRYISIAVQKVRYETRREYV